MNLGQAAIAGAAVVVAVAINPVAGGGTLVSFPTLVWLGLPPVIANATNTVAVWARRELAETENTISG